MGSDQLRIGIVGKRGGAFVTGLQALPDAELTAFCELDETILKEQGATYGVEKLFTRYEAMLEHVDAVVIATPMQLHAEQAILALNAGKHVLSEVASAVTIEECWRLVDAVQRSGKTYMLSENYCYSRDNTLIQAMAGKGLFGELYYGEGEYLHEVRNLHHMPDGSRTWRYFWHAGIRGCTYPTHSLGPVMQWFRALDPEERVESVRCLGTGVYTDPEHPQDDTSLLACQLRSGKLVRVRLDMMSNRPHQMSYYSLQGTRGVYEASRIAGQHGSIWIGDSVDGADRQWKPLSDFEEHLPEEWRHPPEAALRAGHGGGDYFVVRDFVRAAREGSPPPIDVYTGLEWTAAGLCSQISIENDGEQIRVPNFRNPAERPIWLDG